MESSLQSALHRLKKTGGRITPQRHAILAYLIDSHAHPTADHIYKALQPHFPSMSVATVYNNLKACIEAGLVRELTYGDDSSRFDADLSDHYHAICESCGTIADFSYPSLIGVEQAAEQETGYIMHGHRLEVHGVCPKCALTAASKY